MTSRSGSAVANSFKTFVGMILLGVGFMATLGTILGFFGRFWWAFDLLANFRVQYAAVLIVTGIVYGLTMGRITSVIFLAAAIANIVVIVPFFTDQPPAAASDSGELRVVTFNVSASNVRRSETLSWMTESGADLGFIMESSSDWDGALLTLDPAYQVVATVPLDRTFGITAIGRGDAVGEVIRLGEAREPILRITTSIGEEPVVVYAVHPRSPTSEMRAEIRDETLAALADRIRQEEDPVIVVGDLNATPWSAAFQALTKDARLNDSMRGYGLQPTWPDSNILFSIPIDHVLYSDELTTISRDIGPDLGSDHRPLEVVIGFARQSAQTAP